MGVYVQQQKGQVVLPFTGIWGAGVILNRTCNFVMHQDLVTLHFPQALQTQSGAASTINVTLPSFLAPKFRIVDFKPGTNGTPTQVNFTFNASGALQIGAGTTVGANFSGAGTGGFQDCTFTYQLRTPSQ